MNKPTPSATFLNPFAAVGRPSLEDVLRRVEAADLSPTRRRDLLSAVRRIPVLLGEVPSAVAADPALLRERLATIKPGAHQITDKTWRTLRSNLFAAIEVAGVKVLKTASIPLAPAWREFFKAIPDRGWREGLSRLGRFCSLNAIDPGAVDDAVLRHFIEAVLAGTFARQANNLERRVAVLWNRLAEGGGFGHLRRLTVPNHRAPPTRLALSDLPSTFAADVEAYLAWAAGVDVFAQEARDRPLASTTIRLRREQILTAVTALVESGVAATRLQSLADLVDTTHVRRILTRRFADAGEKPTSFNTALAKSLCAIAREWCHVDDKAIQELKRLASRLPAQPAGLTDKNMRLLRNFDDGETLLRLLDLPEALFAEAERQPPSRRSLKRMQAALAIAILPHTGLRMRNLAMLAFNESLFLPRSDQDETRIDIAAKDMKGKRATTCMLPAHVSAMLRRYYNELAPAVIGRKPTYLFSRVDGERKSQAMVAVLVKDTIEKRLGITMTPHQFRHLCAQLMLNAEPGSYESVRQFLSHASSKTTTSFYTGIDGRRASRHVAKLIEKLCTSSEAPPRRRKTRVQSGPGSKTRKRRDRT